MFWVRIGIGSRAEFRIRVACCIRLRTRIEIGVEVLVRLGACVVLGVRLMLLLPNYSRNIRSPSMRVFLERFIHLYINGESASGHFKSMCTYFANAY